MWQVLWLNMTLRQPYNSQQSHQWQVINVWLQFNGYTPSASWNEVYEKIKKMEKDASEGTVAGGEEKSYESGSDMFGFSNPKVLKLIQVCSFINSLFRSGT